MVIRHCGDGRWESVPVLRYKEEGGTFKDVTRQVLFEGSPQLPCQLRYFEVAAGGHSSLERHEHVHVVFVARGEGGVLVGDEVHRVGERDVVIVPGMCWHQFRADRDTPLGFLCLVNAERDRPQLPTEDEVRELGRNPGVKSFVRS
jgi:quercetin dioxygenase-like cupin family protein